MTKKFSQSRKNAFLAALAQTGNQTLAAETAKVSRSWVTLHRSTDPGFDAACRAAIEEAKQAFDRLRADGEGGNKPGSKWTYIGGEELVVRGTGGASPVDPERGCERGRPQISRARLKQWSPKVEARFLAALMACCNVKLALAEVGLSAASAYTHRKRWPDFAKRWDAAIEIGYQQIEMGLLEAAGAMLEGQELPDPPVLREMTTAQAIQLLHMHKYKVHGIGKEPGKAWRPPRTLEELAPGILRKWERAGLFREYRTVVE